jgi:hypothetical protein
MRIDEGHKEKTGHPFSEITQTTLARTGLLPEGCSHCRASEPGIGRTTLRSWASSSDPHIHLVPRANADSSDSSATSCCQPASGTSSGQPPRPSLRENLAEAEGHGPSVLLPLRPAARRRSHGRLPPLPPLWFHPSKVLADDKVASHPTAQRLLNVLKPIFDDVWKELISEGVFPFNFMGNNRNPRTRPRLVGALGAVGSLRATIGRSLHQIPCRPLAWR